MKRTYKNAERTEGGRYRISYRNQIVIGMSEDNPLTSGSIVKMKGIGGAKYEDFADNLIFFDHYKPENKQ